MFHDEVVATKILNARNPAHAKALPYQINGVSEQTWQTESPKIMSKGLLLKFANDPLIKTGSRKLGEASASDKIALNTGAWIGQNVIGRLLEQILDKLKNK